MELLATVAKSKEERDGMEQLWQDAKQQLQSRQAEWEGERSALYQELARLRMALKSAGVEASSVPPALPPRNLASAILGEVPEEAAEASTSSPGGGGLEELSTGSAAPTGSAPAPATTIVAAPPPAAAPEVEPTKSLPVQQRIQDLEAKASDIRSMSSAELAKSVAARAAAGGGARAISLQ